MEIMKIGTIIILQDSSPHQDLSEARRGWDPFLALSKINPLTG
jgi:hypothetical protein